MPEVKLFFDAARMAVEMASTRTSRLMPRSRSNRSSIVISSEFINSIENRSFPPNTTDFSAGFHGLMTMSAGPYMVKCKGGGFFIWARIVYSGADSSISPVLGIGILHNGEGMLDFRSEGRMIPANEIYFCDGRSG